VSGGLSKYYLDDIDTTQTNVCNANQSINPKQLTTFSALTKSIIQNYKSWICIIIAIYVISKPNLVEGYFTFSIMLWLVYYIHKESHSTRNFLTIAHHYHHENNNFIAHFVQILLEFQAGCGFNMMTQYIFNGRFFNTWTMILFYLFYTSVHNINYSIYHVNHTHELHHKNQDTNIGPDICDIIFGTKNDNTDATEYIENTDHYIINIIIGTLIVLILQSLYSNDTYKLLMDSAAKYTLMTSTTLIFILTTYIYYADKKVYEAASSNVGTGLS
jgi:hypothetical protein